MSEIEVSLGEHTLSVYPQRHAYLTNKMEDFVQELAEQGNADISNAAGLLTMLGDRAYDLMVVLLPQYGKRCPKYEFAGYGSQVAYDAREYDEREDKSPSFPEIVNAFDIAVKVNRFDIFKVLGKIIDPKMLRAWISLKISQQISGDAAPSPATAAGSQE